MSGLQTAHSKILGDAFTAGFQPFVDQSAMLTAINGTPGTGQFRSSITGRATIPDIANDLRVSLGVERVMTQAVVLVPNEFGSNGETVYSALNDDRGLIRFVGSFYSYIGTNGLAARTDTAADYVEIVFYGTGLNLLAYSDATTRNWRVTVDGGAEGGSSVYLTTSAVLGVKNYAMNVIMPLVSGLTLGLHTVKLKMYDSPLLVYGFEIVNTNTSSYLTVNPGTGYLASGQKYINSAIDTIHYGKDATNTTTLLPAGRGGRVVRYLQEDGTVGYATTAVNVAAAYLAVADHTNEELVRTYNWREFGCNIQGSPSVLDFSTVSSSYTARCFTLDDGTTTLTSSGVQLATTGFNIQGSGTYAATITFIGTGIDISQLTVGSGFTDAIIIDGTQVGTLTGMSIINGHIKLASGLPYGTHNVRIQRAAGSALEITDFHIYQPKKPTIPSSAVELCDYNVMATFAANTVAGLETIATGVMRKSARRELVHTGTTWTYNTAAVDGVSGRECGYESYSASNPKSFGYTFWGTGFEIRGYAQTDGVTAATVTLNGTTLTAANFPTMTASNYGGWTLNTGTGAFSQKATAQIGAGVRVSGLPLGLYTLLFSDASTSYFRFSVLDIITPIHSYKSNLYADLQNTLPVGSNSLMDSRKTSLIKDALPGTKAWAQAVGIASNPTINNPAGTAVAVPMPDMSVTIKTSGGPIQMHFIGAFYNNVTGSYAGYISFWVDGVQVGKEISAGQTTALYNYAISNTCTVPLAAGTHKIDVYWVTNMGGTLYSDGGKRLLTVREL